MTRSTLINRLSRHFSSLHRGGQRRRRTVTRSAAAGLESLENRKLLSATGGGITVEEIARENGGYTVMVNGTDDDDVIELRTNGKSADGFDIYGNGDLLYSGDFFAGNGLWPILNGGDGNDRLVSDEHVANVKLNGGAGDDVLLTGGKMSNLDGGAGNDALGTGGTMAAQVRQTNTTWSAGLLGETGWDSLTEPSLNIDAGPVSFQASLDDAGFGQLLDAAESVEFDDVLEISGVDGTMRLFSTSGWDHQGNTIESTGGVIFLETESWPMPLGNSMVVTLSEGMTIDDMQSIDVQANAPDISITAEFNGSEIEMPSIGGVALPALPDVQLPGLTYKPDVSFSQGARTWGIASGSKLQGAANTGSSSSMKMPLQSGQPYLYFGDIGDQSLGVNFDGDLKVDGSVPSMKRKLFIADPATSTGYVEFVNDTKGTSVAVGGSKAGELEFHENSRLDRYDGTLNGNVYVEVTSIQAKATTIDAGVLLNLDADDDGQMEGVTDLSVGANGVLNTGFGKAKLPLELKLGEASLVYDARMAEFHISGEASKPFAKGNRHIDKMLDKIFDSGSKAKFDFDLSITDLDSTPQLKGKLKGDTSKGSAKIEVDNSGLNVVGDIRALGQNMTVDGTINWSGKVNLKATKKDKLDKNIDFKVMKVKVGFEATYTITVNGNVTGSLDVDASVKSKLSGIVKGAFGEEYGIKGTTTLTVGLGVDFGSGGGWLKAKAKGSLTVHYGANSKSVGSSLTAWISTDGIKLDLPWLGKKEFKI